MQEHIKIVEISGTPYERGRQYGESAKEKILAAMKDWRLSLHRNHLKKPEDYLKEFLSYGDFQPAIDRWAPGMLDEVRGLADGAGVDFETMYAYQLADEEWIYGIKECQWKKEAQERDSETGQNCSALGVFGQPDLPNYLAQNMDLPGWSRGHQILLKIDYGEFQVMLLTVAGMVATTGVNSRGLGICCNTLFDLDHCHDGLPVAFVVRRVLEMSSFSEAANFVQSVKHASGQNYTIGDVEEIGAFESAAGKVARYIPDPDMPRVFHTNHPIVNDDKDYFDQYQSHQSASFQQEGPNNSEIRYAALENRLGKHRETVTIDDIKAALRSHDDPHNPICVDVPTVLTFGSVIYELNDSPALHLTVGAPCKAKYQAYKF